MRPVSFGVFATKTKTIEIPCRKNPPETEQLKSVLYNLIEWCGDGRRPRGWGEREMNDVRGYLVAAAPRRGSRHVPVRGGHGPPVRELPEGLPHGIALGVGHALVAHLLRRDPSRDVRPVLVVLQPRHEGRL